MKCLSAMSVSTDAADCEIIPLVEELLRQGRLVRLRVTGRSMAPWLENGVVVTLRRVAAAALRSGDVVLFRAGNGRPLLHRVIRRERAEDGTVLFLIKGDACAAADGHVPGNRIVGKVVAVTREAAYGKVRRVSFESCLRQNVHRLLAAVSHRAPRLFCALCQRILSPLRRFHLRFSL